MKKVFLLATAFLFVTGVAMADKGKKKKCAKGKTCCTKTDDKAAGCSKSKDATATKACCKDKAKSTTASM
ncbi:MAG: hypothetical protein WAT20_08940 [Ferruginibacter sp.]|nr:hypothetical protein [Chitinophagaceae bacterium]